METHKATINRSEEKAMLVFSLGDEIHEIALTEDKPNDIKHVFNELISKALSKYNMNTKIDY